MAKKKKKSKLNRSLLLYIVLGAAVVGGGGFGAYRYLRAQSTEGELKNAMEAFEKKDWEAARKSFDRYTSRDKGKTDAPARMKYIEVLSHLTSFDEKHMPSIFQVNEHALQIDPNNKAALENYLNLTFDYLEGRGEPGTPEMGPHFGHALERTKDYSASLLRVDPQSQLGAEAAAVAELITLQRKSAARTMDDLDAGLKIIQAHREKHPLSRRLRASEFQILGNMISQLSQNGVKVKIDYADPPAGPLLQKLRGELPKMVDMALNGTEPSLSNNDRVEYLRLAVQMRVIFEMLAEAPTAERIKASEEILDWTRKAAQMATPADTAFIPALTDLARQEKQRVQFADAEATLKRIVDAFPNDWKGRILLADFYRSLGRYKDGLDLLTVDLKPSHDRIGPAGQSFSAQGPEAVVRRAELRARSFAVVPEADRGSTRKLIDEERGQSARLFGESNPRVKLVDAAVKRYIDNDLPATQELLRQARNEIRVNDNRFAELGDEIDLESVEVALLRGQTGTARELLLTRMKEGERNPAMILRLVDVYVREGNFAEARNLLKPLEEGGKDNPTFQNAWIVANRDQPVVTKQLLTALPEGTEADRVRKFSLAVSVNQPDIYSPLLERVISESGSSTTALSAIQQALVNLRVVEAERERIDKVIADAIAKYPDVKLYSELQKVLKLKSPEELDALRDEEITKLEPYPKAIALARRAAARGDGDGALARLTEAVQLDPDAKLGGEAQVMLFQLYATQGKFDEANKMLDVLAKVNHDKAGGRIWRSRFLIAQGKTAEALTLAKQVQAELPDYTAAWVTVAMAQSAGGDLQEALRTIDVALRQTPQDLESLRLGITTARQLGRRADIERYVAQARQRYPQSLEFELVQLDVVAQFGDPESTVVRREQLAKANEQNAEFQYQLGRTYYLVGRKYAFAQNEAESTKWLEKSVDAQKAGMERFPNDLRFLGDFAILSLGAKNNTEAGMKAFEAVRARPEMAGNVDLEMKYGGFLLTINKPADARKIFEGVVAKQPKFRPAIEAVAQTYLAEQRTDDAIKTLQTLGDDADALFAQADILARTGKTAEALEAIEKVVKLSNNAPRARARQAELLIDLNRLEDARKIADAIVTDHPSDASGRFLRALIEMRGQSPDREKAIADLQAVRDATPTNVLARLQLAELYQQTGRAQESEQEVESTYRENRGNRMAVLRVLALHAANARWQTMISVIEDARKEPLLVNDIDIMMNESVAYDGLQDGPKAIAAAKRVLDAAPKSGMAGNSYLMLLAKHGTVQDVEREAQRVLKDLPSAWWAKNALAIAYIKQGKKTEGLALIKEALAFPELTFAQRRELVLTVDAGIGPKEAIALAERSLQDEESSWGFDGVTLYRRAGEMQKARELVGRLVVKAPGFGKERIALQRQIFTRAAEFYLTDSPPQIEKAVESYGRLLTLGEVDILSMNNYADALTRLGGKENYTKALEIAEVAYKQAEAKQFTGPRDAYIMDTYGWCLILNDRVEDGMRIVQEAMDRENLPESCYHLAEGYLKQKNPETAKALAQKGLDIISRQKQNGVQVDEDLLRRLQDALQRASQ